MALVIKKPLVPSWFVPDSTKEEDAPDDKQVRFFIGPLTSPQVLEVWEHFDQKSGSVKSIGLEIAARYAVRQWENITDEEGKDLRCTQLNIAKLPFYVIAEIGAEAVKRAVLEEAEIKNS